MNLEKQSLPVLLDKKTGNPIAIIFFNQNRDRIIYTLSKADEEEIVALFNYEQKANSVLVLKN